MAPSPVGETSNPRFSFFTIILPHRKTHFGYSTMPFPRDREAVEDCFLVLYTRKMNLNKEETHKQGQNKAPDHQASSHTSLQNQDLSKDYKIHKYLILINPTVVTWSTCAPNSRRFPNNINVQASLKLLTEKYHSLTL